MRNRGSTRRSRHRSTPGRGIRAARLYRHQLLDDAEDFDLAIDGAFSPVGPEQDRTPDRSGALDLGHAADDVEGACGEDDRADDAEAPDETVDEVDALIELVELIELIELIETPEIIETAELVETVEIIETAETIELVETVEIIDTDNRDESDAARPFAEPPGRVAEVVVAHRPTDFEALARTAARFPASAAKVPVRLVGGAARLAVGTGAAYVVGTCSVARHALGIVGPWRQHGEDSPRHGSRSDRSFSPNAGESSVVA